LEELHISNALFIENPEELNGFLQGIAAAPKLRTLSLKLQSYPNVVSAQQQSEMFVNALKECKNSSLEVFIGTFSVGQDKVCVVRLWNHEVIPIFDFNRERRRIREHASSFPGGGLLLRALMIAETTNNHHLRFWVVRNYAGDLCQGESEQVPSRSVKPKHSAN
jgi:hypothetical protein